MRAWISVTFLALAALACMQPIDAITPTNTPPPVTATPTRPPATVAASPTPPATVANSTRSVARVVAAVVNVRVEPGGEIVGQVEAGQSVTVAECSGDWCRIEQPLEGWIFRGCLEGLADGRKCEATK